VKTIPESLPTDLAAAHAMILAERAARVQAEAVAALAQGRAQTARPRRPMRGRIFRTPKR
jgi:hypothetical protein